MIYGVNGQPYVSLDHDIDVDGLERIYYEICEGIACAKVRYTSSILEKESNHAKFNHAEILKKYELWNRLIDARDQVVDSQIDEIGDDNLPEWVTNEQIRSIHSKLSWPEKKRFEQFALGAFVYGESIPVRNVRPNFEHNYGSFVGAECFDENVEYFQLLRNWINELPLKEIGRVFVLVSYNNLIGRMHHDRRDANFDQSKYQFLWLNPFGKKQLYILDTESRGKYYVKSKAAIWNAMDLHSTDATQECAFSIRIDGQFTEEFCKKNNIPWSSR